MQPESRESLLDARAAAIELRLLATNDWINDRVRALAVERLIIILGEALLRVRSTEVSLLERITDSHKVIGMRNVVVHGYDALDPARIQDAIDMSLPTLIDEIAELLGE